MIHNWGVFLHLNFAFTDSVNKSEILHCDFQEASPSLINAVNNVNDVVNLVDKPWNFYFDGSRSKECVGGGCMLLDPIGNKHMLYCRLEFLCTNNAAKYEALVQGLKKALVLNVKVLVAFGDSEIIVQQVRNSIHCLSNHLQSYQKEVWNMISTFDSFTIESIPRFQNQEADLLENVAS